MYLKSIEVHGFKSFANRIKFEFHNGITGIVGPNGSGKSNVADAVRWVLGEQRIKQLRGAKMEDVIFAGTENRKPLGSAMVAITLDNSEHDLPIEYDEVTVSRRIFRSGESEYKINGTNCRLKDINELFYDTGIGKEGYSIIGQGQIDKILSGKPEERRELFDEAAGIVKYKRRKIVTQKKLEDERNNLVRVNDILSELEKQVKPLERQSETARKYISLKEELKTFDINLFLMDLDITEKKLTEITKNIEIAQNDLQSTKDSYEKTKIDYESIEKYIDEITQKLENKKNELNQITLFNEKQESEIKIIEEQINSSNQNYEHYNSRVDSIQETIKKYKEEQNQYEDEKEKNKSEIDEIDKGNDEESTRLKEITGKIEQLNEQIEDSKSEIIELLNQKSSIQSKIQRYDTMLEQISIRKAEISQKLLKSSSDKANQEESIKELTEELKKVNEEIIELSDKSESIKTDINNIVKEEGSINESRQRIQKDYHINNSRLESLKNITERYEGYGNSIRKVMEVKETQKGVIGVVADIIQTEKKYEVAVETSLGGNIQNIVTDNETTAKSLIEYLKKNKFGRATFLPISSIANRTGFNNERALNEKGVIGLASDLVKIKKEYEAIAKYLLGRIVVVDNIDNALLISRKYNRTLRIVTLEGELVNPGGSMTGGAFRNQSNLLGRRREIEELEKKIKQLAEELKDYEKRAVVLKDKKVELASESEATGKVLQEQYLVQNTVKMNLNQAGQRKQEIIDLFNDCEKENNEILLQISDIKENNNELNDELKTYEELNSALEEKIKNLTDETSKQRENEEQQNKKVEEFNIKGAGLKQKNDFLCENINRIELSVNELNKELEEIKKSREESVNSTKDKEDQISSIKEAILKASEKSNELNGEITALSESKEEQSKEHKDFFAKREELNEKMSSYDKELFRLNSQKEKLEETNESQISYMWNEYELTISAALELRNEELDNPQEMKKRISSIKNEIKGLGDVNVNAIEDYKNVLERYTFLKTQHDDLVQAEHTLEKIIEELDTGMRKQFKEKFSEIVLEFDKVFKELFGGGKGTISINEDEDILEAGISIISQPPGKKLQNMMQLSGGEKALTAIALLFAIQNLKPSPFCLLDEIEAALDDSNVWRYASYLHKLTKHTQFIVITHRKGTMESADRLYGITMQEKGVSTLVSVDLLESDLEK